MNSSNRILIAFFLLFGLAFAATVGIGDTLLVSGSNLGDEGTPPATESAPARNGTSDTGAIPTPSGSVVVSVGETTDNSGNEGRGNSSPANGTGSSPDSTQNTTPANPQQVMNREMFMFTTASGEAVQAGEIGSVQVSPGRIEVMARNGNGFEAVSAQDEDEPAEVEAEISSSEGNAFRLRIQAMEQQMLLSMEGRSVSTGETLRIRERLMYLERNGTEYRVNVLPTDLPEAESADTSLRNITLEFSEEQPAYRFTLMERRNFLGLFAVDSETRFMLNAQNAQIISEEGPWWGFMAPASEDLRPALNQLSLRMQGMEEN